MKKFGVVFLVVAMTLVSGYAVAITGLDSWSSILKSRDVLIQQPTFAGNFGKDGLFNACATDDEFRSLRPVKTCLTYKEILKQDDEAGEYVDYVCSEYDVRDVRISRTYIKNECARYAPMSSDSSGECVEYRSVTAVYPTSFQFAVIEAGKEEYGTHLFSKTFAVPTCR